MPMNGIKYIKTPKPLVSIFMFILVVFAISLVAYNVTSADEYEADVEIGSWEELIATLNDIEEDSDTVIKLTADITPEEGMDTIIIENGKSIVLDLAGFTIDRGLYGSEPTDDGYVIAVKEGGKLTITDTTGKEGLITGGSYSEGGGIRCEDGSVVTVTGGVRIKNNHANNGGGIYLGIGCELYLGDCSIIENDVTNQGGGIYGGKSAITFLGGLTKIKNNYTGGDDENYNDLYMPADMEKLRFWTINQKNGKTKYCEGFDEGSRIGINLEVMTKVITDGYGQCNQEEGSIYFFYNGADYEVSDDNKNSEVTIVKESKALHDNTKSVVEIYVGDRLKSSVQKDSFIEALSDAVNESGDEKVVIMGGNYTSDEQIEIPENKQVIIDLNGHYIKRERDHETEKDGGVFNIQKGATLTIRDSNPKKMGYDGIKGGVITGGASSNAGGGITIQEEGHLIMEGGTIYDCISDEDGGGVYVSTGSKRTSFKMTGGRINNCKTIDSADKCYGGGIFFGDGILDLSNAKIDNCYSEDDGGAIYCQRGEVILKNMLFSGNQAIKRGGAIYIDLDYKKYDGTLFTAIGCTFVNNESKKDGGAFFMRDNPQHTGAILFDRCVFKGNKADEDGGAIVVFDDGMVLSNVEITENTSGEYGGGVFVDSRYDISLKGVVIIKDNTCKEDAACKDLCLEDGTSTTAYVNSGGLVRGSWIGIGSTNSKSMLLSKNISTYEMKYFHSNVGDIASKNTKEVKVKMSVTSSIFGNGRWMSIFLIGAASLIIMIILIIIKYKKDRNGLDEGGSL